MAGVNNVSTYDNAPENPNNRVEHATNNKAASDTNDVARDSLQNVVIDDEMSGRLVNECETSADRTIYVTDMMLAAESIHSERHPDDDNCVEEEYIDLKSLSAAVCGGDYQAQRDGSELMLLTEKQHAEETANNCSDTGLGSEETVLNSDSLCRSSDADNDGGGPLSDNLSESGFEDGGMPYRDLSDEQQPRVFTRPLPTDETDNVTELVFDTWTTVDEVVRETAAEVGKIEPNDFGEQRTLGVNPAAATVDSPNQECSRINTPSAIITNSVVSFVLNNYNLYWHVLTYIIKPDGALRGKTKDCLKALLKSVWPPFKNNKSFFKQ